jgi:hypothetical protein
MAQNLRKHQKSDDKSQWSRLYTQTCHKLDLFEGSKVDSQPSVLAL